MTESTPQRHFPTIDSTNEAAMQWARDSKVPAPHGAIVTADEQTAGRGRRGRDWVSPAGNGLYLSMIWRPQIELSQIGQLTIVVALATAQAAEEISGVKAHTKWPNDVLLRGRKVGGVLCEADLENTEVRCVVAGVGLNLNFEKNDLPERPVYPATSLAIETGKTFDIQHGRHVLIESMQQEYSRYANGEWNAQRGEFIARCATLGERVRVEGEVGFGVAVGIDGNGFLVVQNADGLKTVAAGDVVIVD
jgi:BirA family transcriptional regulator, biotin operon repressor / biotin---[acetyl-CoA-carboxylase] ligase